MMLRGVPFDVPGMNQATKVAEAPFDEYVGVDGRTWR